MGNNAWLELLQNFLSTLGWNLTNQTNMTTTSSTLNMTTSSTSSTSAGTTPAENEDYCALGADHTMCKFKGPSSSCAQKTKSSGMSQASKEALLAKHNELRRKVAKGEEAGQPGASNMRELVWDEELEAIAQRWADQCTSAQAHDKPKNRRLLDGTSVGQNVGRAWNFAQWNEDQLTEQNVKRVQSWYNEVSLFNSASIDTFSFSSATGHYTQIVWAETDRLGCGTVYYRDDSNGRLTNRLVCNYAVAGNMHGASIYAQGSACSSCPASTTCVDSLCQSA